MIGLRPDAAHLAWESYLDILEAEYAMMADEDDSSAEKMASKAKLAALFDRALRIPQPKLEEIYERYVEFVGRPF